MGDDPTFFCLLGSELIFYNVAKNFTNWTCVSCPPIRPLVEDNRNKVCLSRGIG
jgi:hypothetical protein